MESERRIATVTELQRDGILLVEDGNHGEYRPRPDEFTSMGIAFIRAADIENGRVLFESSSKINEIARKRITKGIGAPGDVLISHKGTVGKVALVPSDAPLFICSPQTTFWRTLDEHQLDRVYLYTFLRSPGFHAQLASRAGETDMAPYVSLTSQRGLSIIMPPIGEQRAIAHIIGSLDNKIELNRRMNETLEAIAQAIFKSWFVDFNPVHAKAEGRDIGLPKELADLFPDSFEYSDIGEIPKGWRIGTFGDVAINPKRIIQPSSMTETIPYIALEHMPKCCISIFKWGASEDLASSKFTFKRNEILFGKLRPYFHKVGIAPIDGICSTDILVIAPINPKWFGFVLGHASSNSLVEYADAGSIGTKMPRTSWQELAKYPVVLPSENVAETFSNQIRPMVNRIILAIHQSHVLSELRDALLPKLISGEFRVPDADRFIKEASS